MFCIQCGQRQPIAQGHFCTWCGAAIWRPPESGHAPSPGPETEGASAVPAPVEAGELMPPPAPAEPHAPAAATASAEEAPPQPAQPPPLPQAAANPSAPIVVPPLEPLRGLPVPVPLKPSGKPLQRHIQRLRIVRLVAGALALLIGAGLAWWLLAEPESHEADAAIEVETLPPLAKPEAADPPQKPPVPPPAGPANPRSK